MTGKCTDGCINDTYNWGKWRELLKTANLAHLNESRDFAHFCPYLPIFAQSPTIFENLVLPIWANMGKYGQNKRWRTPLNCEFEEGREEESGIECSTTLAVLHLWYYYFSVFLPILATQNILCILNVHFLSLLLNVHSDTLLDRADLTKSPDR